MSIGRSGRPKARRFLMGAALVATLGGAAFGALPVYASAPAGTAHSFPPPEICPPDPYEPDPCAPTPAEPTPYDEETPGSVAPVEFDSASLKVSGTVGVRISATVTVTAWYDTPVTFTVRDRTKLPPGVVIGADGKITGTPTKAGTYVVPVEVCSGGDCATGSVTITIAGPAAPSWTVNLSYEGSLGRPVKGQITVTGTPYGARPTFTVTDPRQLPPGITIGADGTISGTPTKAGTYTFTVRICAGGTCTETVVTITVSVGSTRLEILVEGFSGVLNRAATGLIKASGVPYGSTVTYSVVDPGKLPPGISISADGKITGTPTKAGTFVVPIKICLGSGCATASITLTVGSSSQMLIVLTGFSGSVGQQVTGRYILEGAGQATFTVLDATKLPPGVSLAADGSLSGVATSKGSFTFPVRICVGTACGNTTLTLTILAGLPAYGGSVTTTQVTVIICTCGETQLALPTEFGTDFTVVDPSSLPPGITVTAGGVIKGKATTPGTYSVLLKVGDETWKTVFVVGAKEPVTTVYRAAAQ